MLNDMGGSVIAAFDNTGKVFAVACTKTQTISMYATENFDSVSASLSVALRQDGQPDLRCRLFQTPLPTLRS